MIGLLPSRGIIVDNAKGLNVFMRKDNRTNNTGVCRVAAKEVGYTAGPLLHNSQEIDDFCNQWISSLGKDGQDGHAWAAHSHILGVKREAQSLHLNGCDCWTLLRHYMQG